MMTKDEAKAAVETKLRAMKLTQPLDGAELLIFSIETYNSLQFRSKSDRLSDIRIWAERWQSLRFPRR